jgi:hypothetical protein
MKIKTDSKMKKGEKLINEAVRRMNKDGFKCHKDDKHFIIEFGGKQYSVHAWSTSHTDKLRVNFCLEFGFEGMDKVQPQGLTLLTSECNNHHDLTTTLLHEDHFTCRVETVIGSAKEFSKEFVFAKQEIENTIRELADNYEVVKEEFKLQPARRPIGFLADRYGNEEKNDVCKLVAQTHTTFASENKQNN